MELVTVATSNNHYVQEWLKSARQFGYKPTVLGVGKPWHGFRTKIALLVDYLEALPPGRLVASTDCYDLIMAAPQSELLEKYRSLGRDVLVVGAEKTCSLNCHREAGETCSTGHHLKYPNGGFVMGRAGALSDAYQFMMEHAAHDDQIGMGMYMLKDCSKVLLDHDSLFVGNIYRMRDVKLNPETGRFAMVKSGNTPVALHMPNMHVDLGKRSNVLRNQVLHGAYTKTRKSDHIRGLIKHYTVHMTNPAYTRVWVPVLIVVVLGIVATIVGVHLSKKGRI